MSLAPITIRRLHAVDEADLQGLADVLIDCVEGGASVGFMLPLSRQRALEFWAGVGADVESGARALLVAEDEAGIVGTVQLILAQADNQQHRADLAKLQVHRRGRRRGIGAQLTSAVEDVARDNARTLLVLDTVTGSDASRLYARLGWQRSGDIPGYALWPQGGLCSTTIYYKQLAAAAPG